MNYKKRIKTKLLWLKTKPYMYWLKGGAILKQTKNIFLFDFSNAPSSYEDNLILNKDAKMRIN